MYRKISSNILKFAKIFHQNNYELFLVGGAVRNMVLNVQPKDWDFATNALPHDLLPLFRKVIPTGIDHGTITVLFEGSSFEVTTFRIDGDYSDSRRPDSVTFAPTIYEDLSRRDFTMNAMAIDLRDGTLLDPHSGQKDISLKTIRTVGVPGDRFREDALRILRAVRFSSQLGFSIENNAKEEIRALSSSLQKVSVERFRDELIKILQSEYSDQGLSLGFELGVFNEWIPELTDCEYLRDERDDSTLVSHLFRTAGYLRESRELPLVIAGLFHDIAKPHTLEKSQDGRVHFPSHDIQGAEMTATILRRLKFPKEVIFRVVRLVENHMYDGSIVDSPRAIRRFISRVGFETALLLTTLRRGDILAKTNSPIPLIEATFTLEQRIRQTYNDSTNAFTLKDLNINGEILQKELSIPKGKVIGSILNELLETVLDDPSINEPAKLLVLSRNIYESRWKVLVDTQGS